VSGTLVGGLGSGTDRSFFVSISVGTFATSFRAT
jgi:hypothetical protein